MAPFKTRVPPLWRPRCDLIHIPSDMGRLAAFTCRCRPCPERRRHSIGPASQLLCSRCVVPWVGWGWGRGSGKTVSPAGGKWGGEESGECRRVAKAHSLPFVNSIPFTIYQVLPLCQTLCWALGTRDGSEAGEREGEAATETIITTRVISA